jgi:hypothetical protein
MVSVISETEAVLKLAWRLAAVLRLRSVVVCLSEMVAVPKPM